MGFALEANRRILLVLNSLPRNLEPTLFSIRLFSGVYGRYARATGSLHLVFRG